MTKSTQSKKNQSGRWREGVRNRRIATLLTKSKNSSKAPLFEEWRVEDQEIDANDAIEEISELALEGGGSEFDDLRRF